MSCTRNCYQGRRCTCAPRQVRPWWIALPGLVAVLSIAAAVAIVLEHAGR